MPGATGRIVVTGHDRNGVALFVSDDVQPEVDLAPGGVRARFLWGRDDIASFPDDGAAKAEAPMPPPGGARFSTLTLPAGANNAYHGFIAQNLGPMADPAAPGFHCTPSLDLIIVLDGEVELELDQGAARTLRRGDSVVLNGVRHRWSNESTSDATILAIMIGARDTRSLGSK
ncbi:MAG: cupin domain-containing protein [Hyphomonadaceae bacterium]|nr:cupin domain-containing protein [Hyphomonadaceae bacterium]